MTLTATTRAIARAFVLAGAVASVVGCQEAATGEVFQLTPLNDSGVTGTVTLIDLGGGKSRVDVEVEPAGNPDMPAHIHPGSCADLIPQPEYPLENVEAGSSTTVVAATVGDLTRGGLAVNLHKSNDDLRTYTACADLR